MGGAPMRHRMQPQADTLPPADQPGDPGPAPTDLASALFPAMPQAPRSPFGVIIDQLRASAEALAAEYPDLADDDRAWMDTLEGITDGVELADRILRRRNSRKRLEEAAGVEIADLQKRQARFAKQAAAAERAAMVVLAAAVPPNKKGTVELERPSYTARLRKGTLKVEVTDMALLPPELIRTPPAPEPTPDKVAIAARLKAQQEAIDAGADIKPLEGAKLVRGETTLVVTLR